MKSEELTIILPCAGDGIRMNLSYPKELFEIFPGIKLLDFSLDHIKYFSHRYDISVKVAVVIKKDKESVFEYVKDKLTELSVFQVNFNKKFREWPGSVFSAYDHFSEKNMVLLPDSFISMGKNNRFADDRGKGIIEHSIEELKKRSVVFGIKSVPDRNILRNLGAVRVKDEKIDVFIDKPEKTEGLNGFWCSYGFRIDVAKELYEFLIKSVEKRGTDIMNASFFPPGFYPVFEYYDLGTVSSVDKFKLLKNREFIKTV